VLPRQAQHVCRLLDLIRSIAAFRQRVSEEKAREKGDRIMTTECVSVLLVEDNRGDALLLQERLLDAGPGRFVLTWVDRLEKALDRLKADVFGAVLLDLTLPDSQGLASLERLHAAAERIPIVIVTGVEDEALALQAIRQGAQDYMVKGALTGRIIARVIQYAIDRKRAEERCARRSGRKWKPWRWRTPRSPPGMPWTPCRRACC